ncbi:unnamed protein product [Owenia fusiformis]|uniref:Uncharacterized protein n=1 Tax=Owenia fusiformis TaxID=6347 RepID=A0A8J1UJ43_OWEFU|nr:unnamed protein product [Owenia fusiformis]
MGDNSTSETSFNYYEDIPSKSNTKAVQHNGSVKGKSDTKKTNEGEKCGVSVISKSSHASKPVKDRDEDGLLHAGSPIMLNAAVASGLASSELKTPIRTGKIDVEHDGSVHFNFAHIVSEDSPRLFRKNVDGTITQVGIPERDTDSVDTNASAGNVVTNGMKNCQNSLKECCSKNSSWIIKIVLFILLCVYSVYFVFAIIHSVDSARALIVLTSFAVFFIIWNFVRDHFGDRIFDAVCEPAGKVLNKQWFWLKWVLVVGVFVGIVVYLAVDVIKNPMQLASLGGALAMLCFLFLTSTNPDRVRMRPVAWGLGIQFVMGSVILRWSWAYEAVDWLSDQIQAFLSYVIDASEVVFGDPGYIDHPFIFLMMPMLIYFAAVMAILYYIGVIQVVVLKLGWLFQRTLGTTAVESLNSSANIFLNGMDTMLMLRPYLVKLTMSELQALMVGNHTTVAGFAFALFILLGAPGRHLLTAAVMSAPAGMAVAKLNYPETEESQTGDDITLEDSPERNIVEAATNGAKVAGQTVAAVVVNFVAVLAILAFFNATLKWLGERVGQDNWSFQFFCSYLFLPVSLCMGVEWKDARNVASLVGLKLFTSEFLAYGEMGEMIDRGELSQRSVAITTYALCGFSGLTTFAISVGVWTAIEPRRLHDVVAMMPRTMLNANFACFLTACYAGLLYNEDVAGGGGGNNSTITTPPPDFTWPPWLPPIDEIIGCIIDPDNCLDSDTRLAAGQFSNGTLNGTFFGPTPTVPMSAVYS